MAAAPPLENDLRLVANIAGIVLLALGLPAAAASSVTIVQGLGGSDAYEAEFARQVAALEAAARSLRPAPRVHVLRGESAARGPVLEHFAELAASAGRDDPVIIYLVGHGSYDDHEYKFNIPGPDLTGADIADALGGLESRNQVLVNTSSASGAAAESWMDESRVVITATRSGVERHATRFGGYFADALANPDADLDKNQRISAREAYDYASRRVTDYFDRNGQLPTEHPRMEGDRAERFALANLGRSQPASDDRVLVELTAARDGISARIEELRLSRDDIPPAEYQQRLLGTMLELAEAEDAIEARREALGLDE